MKATELRRHLHDQELKRLSGKGRREVAFRSILDRLTESERLFTFSRSQREKIAGRAALLLASPRPPTASVRALLSKGKWRERAAAASTLLRNSHAVRAVGSLTAREPEAEMKRHPAHDGVAASRALATAIREIGTTAVVEAQARVTSDAAVALRQEEGGAQVWEKALSPLLREFAWNAVSAGATRQEALLEAVAAAAVLTGRTRHVEQDDIPFQLGSAARSLIHMTKTPAPETLAAQRLAEDLTAWDGVRQRMWEDLDAEETRLLGAAAACAVFGKGSPFRRVTSAHQRVFDGAIIPEAWQERFAHITAADAAGELERLAADPRLDEDERASAEFAAEAARSHLGASSVSFSEALGLETPVLRLDRLRPGRLFRAAPRGRRPARVHCRGKNGRLIRCRAIADAQGALVGYLAFDPLSREYGGRPLFAAYGLDGIRQGYAWADVPAYWNAGRPEQGFTSVPESIPI